MVFGFVVGAARVVSCGEPVQDAAVRGGIRNSVGFRSLVVARSFHKKTRRRCAIVVTNAQRRGLYGEMLRASFSRGGFVGNRRAVWVRNVGADVACCAGFSTLEILSDGRPAVTIFGDVANVARAQIRWVFVSKTRLASAGCRGARARVAKPRRSGCWQRNRTLPPWVHGRGSKAEHAIDLRLLAA